MKPHGQDIGDGECARFCWERTSKAMVIAREIQDKKILQPVNQTEVKRTRRDHGELEAILFKLFEAQPNWTLKQLVQKQDRGSNQGTYEIKPEYKKAAEEDGGKNQLLV